MCKLADRRDWLWGRLGLALVGRAMFSESLIQFSVDEWSCAPSQLVVWLRCPVLELTGSMVGLKATSRRTYANMHLSGL